MGSQFVHSGLSGNFIEDLRDQAYRNAIRKSLASKGFTWIKTSGTPTSQMWNIDNWPTQSLENISRAYNEWGGIVADLHNRQKFYPENTAHYPQIRVIVEEHQNDYIPSGDDSDNDDSSTGGGNNTGGDSGYVPPVNNNPPVQAGYGGSLPSWAIPAGIVTVGGTLLILLLKN